MKVLLKMAMIESVPEFALCKSLRFMVQALQRSPVGNMGLPNGK